MKLKKQPLFYLPLIVFILLFTSCGGNKGKEQQTEKQPAKSQEIKTNAESQALLDYLVELGDYANSRDFPSLIKASVVYDELNDNNLIIDLRNKETYADGHIKGAVNIDFKTLPEYFSQEIKPFEYNRIVLVCYAGQIASYASSLLRLKGYGNVYAMRWGMSGWNPKFAKDSWFDAVGSEFQEDLETTDREKAPKAALPELNTGETSGEKILEARIDSLFHAGFRDALIYADGLFESPEDYYIINYDRRDKYESGHIPGAIRYKPGATLGIKSEMETIPSDKKVVTYCTTGHTSGFVTAYLRLFGYDAKTLAYGNNSFMYDKMVEDKDSLSWLPFTEHEVEEYPYVTN